MAFKRGTPRGHVHSVTFGFTQHILFCTYAEIKGIFRAAIMAPASVRVCKIDYYALCGPALTVSVSHWSHAEAIHLTSLEVTYAAFQKKSLT